MDLGVTSGRGPELNPSIAEKNKVTRGLCQKPVKGSLLPKYLFSSECE
jgi:hypothetical protein